MKKILVTGSNGQLGNEISTLRSQFSQYEFLFTDQADLDITDKDALKRIFEKYRFFACINAAAYTAVDAAETDQEMAQKINIEAVGNLAYLCDDYNAHLFHISTDYVFDGKKSFPYTEEDETAALNVYGETKAIGETLALQHRCTFVLRTSWLYSNFGKNFVKTMLRLADQKPQLSIVDDQIGSPTYAADLAKTIFKILETPDFEKKSGLYHYSNEGIASWYDFAKAIFELSNKNVDVLPLRTAQYPTPAQRPLYSVLDKTKIKSAFDLEIPHWRESLQNCLSKQA